MTKIKKKIIITFIIAFALIGIMENQFRITAKAEEQYISVNSDITLEKDGNYWFYVMEPGLLTISPSSDSEQEADFRLWQYDEMTGKSNLVVNKYFSMSESSSFRIGSGLYYLNYNQYGEFTHIFRMELQTEMPESYEREWNDSFDTAHTIKVNSLYTASTLSYEESTYYNVKKDCDYYKFELESQGSVDIYIKKRDRNGQYTSDMEMYKEDEDGNVMLINTTYLGRDESISNSIRYRLPAGVYYLKYIPGDSYFNQLNEEYQFKVNYNTEKPSTYETELNDTSNEASKITTNTVYTGNLQGTDDIDYYTFTLSGSSTVNLKFMQPRETCTKTYRIELYQKDNNGKLLSKDVILTDSNPVKYSEKLTLKKGKYYVKICANGIKSSRLFDSGYDYKYTYDNYELSMIDYKLMVNEVPVSLVESIKISAPDSKVYTGETVTLKSSILPSSDSNKLLKWSTSDEEVAKVDKNGKVTAISSGECYIIATATDGSGTFGKYKIKIQKNTNKKLKSISASTGFLSPKFSSDRANYSLDIGTKNQVTITLKAESKYSIVYIDGKKSMKKTVNLSSGGSKIIRISVAAEDGSEKNYTVTVKRR